MGDDCAGRGGGGGREYAVWVILVAVAGTIVPAVDHAAHAGGLVIGALLGLLPSRHLSAAAAMVSLGLLAVPWTFPSGWGDPWRESVRFEATYRDFAEADAAFADQLRQLGERSRAPDGLPASDALAVLTRDIEPLLTTAQGAWSAAFETDWIEAERQLVLRYLDQRRQMLATLRQAIADPDDAALARFERARQDADALAQELGDAARTARRTAERSPPRPGD